MSDLEDDVLMAFLALSRQMDQMMQRNLLIEEVWKDLHLLVQELLKWPAVAKVVEPELTGLKKSVVAVLTFDEEHQT